MDLLRIGALPFLARRNYYYEFQHLVPWSILAGLIEGQFGSVVVAKTFHGGPLLIAIAAATPVAALSSSLLWGMLCIGRRKIALLSFFAAGTALCAGIVGAIPTSPRGAVWFIGQMAAAQILLAGVVTVRSALWKSNYPHAARGRITARLQTARIIVSNATILVGARLCDLDATAYRYLFPGAALIGAISIAVLPRIRIRGERAELRQRKEPRPERDLRAGLIEPFSLTALLSPGHVFRQMHRVLHEDRRFRRYCIAQLLTGTANLMIVAVVVAIVTRKLQIGDAWGFWIAIGLTQALQRLVMLISLARWGRLFDRIGVVRFRVVNVACWAFSIAFGLAATLVVVGPARGDPAFFPLAVGLFSLRAVFQGLGLGGGVLAWHLGHLHFARPAEAEIYMGVHVSLTGLRGVFAPVLGMWLWQTIGWPVWLIALLLSLGSLSMYAMMARDERQEELHTQVGRTVG